MKGRFIIQSNPNNVEVVEEILQTLGTEFEVSDACLFNVRLALSEAITNAILHGNHSNPHKQVIIDVEALNGRLYCCVADEGTGFDMDALSDPRLMGNREKEGGRGVLFLKEITRHFHYCNDTHAAKFSIDLK
ncbi:MAG: ATP-binding protein [Sphingobacteriaceae bacterium]|nr:ATP-binding protein [Sphingobacteriaceae bacterium]